MADHSCGMWWLWSWSAGSSDREEGLLQRYIRNGHERGPAKHKGETGERVEWDTSDLNPEIKTGQTAGKFGFAFMWSPQHTLPKDLQPLRLRGDPDADDILTNIMSPSSESVAVATPQATSACHDPLQVMSKRGRSEERQEEKLGKQEPLQNREQQSAAPSSRRVGRAAEGVHDDRGEKDDDGNEDDDDGGGDDDDDGEGDDGEDGDGDGHGHGGKGKNDGNDRSSDIINVLPQSYLSKYHSSVPQWLDFDKVNRGQSVFRRYMPSCVFSLFYLSLCAGFSAPLIVEVLLTTGYLNGNRKKVQRRLIETGYMVIAAMLPGGLDAGSLGWTSVTRVRFLHARVRRRLKEMRRKLHRVERVDGVREEEEELREPGEGKRTRTGAAVGQQGNATKKPEAVAKRSGKGAVAERTKPKRSSEDEAAQEKSANGHVSVKHEGMNRGCMDQVAINQEDMSVTLLAFSYNVIVGIAVLKGSNLSLEDQEAYLHVWRYIGYLIGVDEANNPCAKGIAYSKAQLESILMHILEPDQSSAKLVQHMLTATSTNLSPYTIRGLTLRYLLGREWSDKLGLPSFSEASWTLLLRFHLYFSIMRLYTIMCSLPYLGTSLEFVHTSAMRLMTWAIPCQKFPLTHPPLPENSEWNSLGGCPMFARGANNHSNSKADISTREQTREIHACTTITKGTRRNSSGSKSSPPPSWLSGLINSVPFVVIGAGAIGFAFIGYMACCYVT